MVKKTLVGILFLFSFSLAIAQEVVTDGYFHEDSLKIGEVVNFTLYAKYPKEMEIIFPDSTYEYLPFEYYNKDYFTTRIDSIFAYDSVVYSLASFEIDSIQYLQLPIFVLEGKDSTAIYTYRDSIYLKELVIQMPDSLAFKDNTVFQKVNLAFNYPYLVIGLTVLLIILIIVFAVFGKTIKNKIKAYRLRKAYEKFSLEFERGINKIKKEANATLIEEVLIVWKQYMEKLEDKPFTKYTTKEIGKAGYGNNLQQVLKNIDGSIYGKVNDNTMYKNFEALEDFTLEKYQQKLKEFSYMKSMK